MTIEQRVAVLEEIFSKIQDYYTSAYSGEEIDARLASAGVPIGITKEYKSVAEMNQDFTGTDVQRGQFVLILPDSPSSADYGKVYLKGTANWVYAFTLTTLTSIKGPIGPPGKKGDQGDPGEAGSSFAILGYFDTLDALKAAVPNPKAGDVYGVGTAPPYNIYIWDSVHGKWVANGNLQGPQGIQGIQGPQGPQGPRGYPATVNGKSADDSGNIALTAGDVNAYSKTEADTLYSNKAPAGFGYGDTQNIVFWDDEDGTKLEQFLETKFAPASMRSKVYRANLVDSPICKIAGNGGFADIVANNGNDPNGYPENIMIVYYAFCYNYMGPEIAVKQKLNGVWAPWEYVNPPMILGVEYRTTERHLGKPVYVQRISFNGALPANGYEQGIINTIPIATTNIIDINVTIKNRTTHEVQRLPSVSTAGAVTAICNPLKYDDYEEYVFRITVFTDMSGWDYQACIVKYTKSTD